MVSHYGRLLDNLIKDNYLKTPRIIEAFRRVDRADFVLNEYKDDAYVNMPLPIGFGQTISQPLTVAFMLETLQPQIGDKILEIGSGSGWQTAILAEIVGQKIDENNKVGSIFCIERIPELKELTEKNVSKYGFIGSGVVKVMLGDGSKGYKKEEPYDKIIAAASATGDIPKAWKEQLKIGGKIVAPVENSIIVVDKIGKNKYETQVYFGFSFVPLVENSNNK